MIKARISKNMKGTIMLPTISTRSFAANDQVVFTEEQLYAADIQGAIVKNLLIMTNGPSLKKLKTVRVTNLSFGSVTLPGVGVLRGGRSLDINAELMESPTYASLVENGLIAVDLKLKTGAPQGDEIATANVKGKGKSKTIKGRSLAEEVEEIPANMQKGRPITVDVKVDAKGRADAVANRSDDVGSKKAPAKRATAKKKGGVRRVEDDSLLIDLNAPDAPEEHEDFLLDPRTGKRVTGDDGIIFVDAEQTAARRASHPRLKNR